MNTGMEYLNLYKTSEADKRVTLDGLGMNWQEFKETCALIEKNNIKVIKKIGENTYKTLLRLRD